MKAIDRSVFRARWKSLAPLALAGATFVSALYHTPAPAESIRVDPADQFGIGERPFAASSSWNTPIAEGTIYRKVGWPMKKSWRRSLGSWRDLQLAPLPAWSTPRVRQDHGRGPPWTLLHLRLAFWSAHLSFDFPGLPVGADVDVTASKPDVTIPPVTVNSHQSNLGQ